MSEPGEGRTSAQELALLLSRAAPPAPAIVSAVRALDGPAAWRSFLALALEHQIYPLAFANLSRADLGWGALVSPVVMATLRDAFVANRVRAHRIAHDTAALLAALHADRVRALPFKGVALATALYGDPGLRVTTDIDLLVHPADLGAADAALARAGCNRVRAARPVDWLVRHSKYPHLSYWGGAGPAAPPVQIDLHWTIRPGGPFRAAMDDLWREAAPATLAGVACRQMSAEWELLALAAHASHHWLGQLKWLSDIDRLSRIREIRWDQAVAKARRFGWMRMLSVVCGVTRRLYGSPIPDEAAADPLPPWVATFPAPAPADPHDSVRREIRYIPDLRSRASFLAKVVFSPTPREEALVPLPRSLDVLYLGIRPACLAGRWLAGRS